MSVYYYALSERGFFMKKRILCFLIFVFSVVFFMGTRAEAFSFEEIYMTNAEGSTTQVDVFGRNEQPWLYLKAPESDPADQLRVDWSWWHSPDQGISQSFGTTTDTVAWLTLDAWDSAKRLGGWDVYAAYFYTGGEKGGGSTNFTVTPEPVSSVLFLLGGLSLFGFEYKKRKK